MGCGHRGNFDRRHDECRECAYAEECRNGLIDCYGAFHRGDPVCSDCPHAAYCRDAGEITFHDGRHGEPAIVTMEDPEALPPPEQERRPSGKIAMLGAALDKLLHDCDYHPLTVAIVVARSGGASYTEIGDMLGMSKQLVLYKIRRIANPELRAYLRGKKVSRHFHGVVKDNVRAIRRPPPAVQGEFQLDFPKPADDPDFEQPELFFEKNT